MCVIHDRSQCPTPLRAGLLGPRVVSPHSQGLQGSHLNLSQTSAQRHRTYFLLNNKAVNSRRVCTRQALGVRMQSAEPFGALDRGTYEELLPASLRAEIPSPQLVVFMDQVKHNLATMLAHCGGDAARWRPHLKTTKMASWAEPPQPHSALKSHLARLSWRLHRHQPRL